MIFFTSILWWFSRPRCYPTAQEAPKEFHLLYFVASTRAPTITTPLFILAIYTCHISKTNNLEPIIFSSVSEPRLLFVALKFFNSKSVYNKYDYSLKVSNMLYSIQMCGLYSNSISISNRFCQIVESIDNWPIKQ